MLPWRGGGRVPFPLELKTATVPVGSSQDLSRHRHNGTERNHGGET